MQKVLKLAVNDTFDILSDFDLMASCLWGTYDAYEQLRPDTTGQSEKKAAGTRQNFKLTVFVQCA